MYQILDGGARHFFAGGLLSSWGNDCGSHRLIVVGPTAHEPPFCNAVGTLVISVRTSVDMSDKVIIPPSNTRATQTVPQIDRIDDGAWAGNGEGDEKDQPSPGAVCRDGNRTLLLEQRAMTYEN